MADENYTDFYYDSESQKEGIEIRGKDAVFLNSPSVLLNPEIELPTESRDLIEILNELFQSGGEGSDGNLRIVYDDEINILTIGIETVEEGETVINENLYGYTKVTFSEKITINKEYINPDGSVTSSTVSRNFTKTVITSLYLPGGLVIFHAEYDSKGNVTGYFDADGNEIYLDKELLK